MILNVEPFVVLPDRKEGYHVEDLVLVTENGHRMLTQPQTELLLLGSANDTHNGLRREDVELLGRLQNVDIPAEDLERVRDAFLSAPRVARGLQPHRRRRRRSRRAVRSRDGSD